MTQAEAKWSRVNWRQAAGEAFLLLIGVLLALGGQAWWETRVERQTIREYVANLLVEVRANASGLDNIIGDHDEKVGHGTALIRLMEDSDTIESTGSIQAQLSKLTRFSDFRPATAALDNLVGAGGFGLLDNPELQLAVSKYSQAIDDHNVLQVELADFIFHTFNVFLSNHVPLLKVDFANDDLPEPRPQGRFEFDPALLTSSFHFENIVVRRVSAEADARKDAQRHLDASNHLLPLLEGAQ